MKPIFKKLSTIAAIGMSLYAVHCLSFLFPIVWKWRYRLLPVPSVYDDAYFGVWFAVLTGVTIVTIIALSKQGREPAAPSKSYVIATYITTIFTIVVMVAAFARTHSTSYAIPNLCVRNDEQFLLAVLAAVWLWLMSRQNGIGRVSKPLRIAGIVGIVVLCIPLIRMLASVIYYCITGYLIYYSSWAIASWTHIIVPAFLLCWYCGELVASKESH